MRLIVGLGNPGRRYRGTRHNIGHEVVELVGRRHGLAIDTDDGWAEIGRGVIGGHRVILARPGTYVNVSGAAVLDLRRRHRVALEHLLVVCDDLDLPPGTVRLRPAGGHGGHNGLRSVIEALGTTGFPRMRVGIGRPPAGIDPADFVLERPGRDERAALDDAIARAADGVALWITEGIEAAMRHCNPGRPAATGVANA
jgi:PTH1 family peptidyl-tRNA hydrolase